MKELIREDLYPSIERQAKSGNVVSFNIRNRSEEENDFAHTENIKIPYIEDLLKEVQKVNTSLERVIIVSKSEPVAVKVARYLLDHEAILMASKELEEKQFSKKDPYGVFDDDADDDFLYEYDEEEKSLEVFKFSKGVVGKEMPVNIYLRMVEGLESNAILYEGFDFGAEDLEEKRDAILADERTNKYIWITPEMMEHPIITGMRMEQGFALIKIGDVSQDYYESIFVNLLNSTDYKLHKSLHPLDIVNRVSKKRGMEFCEEDLDWILQHAIYQRRRADGKNFILKPEDFALNEKDTESAIQRLEQMPGLTQVKEMITEQTALLLECRRNEKVKDIHGNMIFYGNPGTGKTTCARLLAEVMAENGIANTSFTEASRADIIGQYVGTTAVKVAELFQKARNGVLFIDEAGFFLNTNSGGYVSEAIKEFVRFMENCPDVTVIFAMYEREAESFLKLDEGLRSRISRVIEFKDYSAKEMQEILVHMAKTKGYTMEKEAASAAMEYISTLKKDKNFGNARELRKIVESSIIAHSVRMMKEKAKNKDVLTLEDVTKGMERLKKKPQNKKEFGFQNVKNTNYGTGCYQTNVS